MFLSTFTRSSKITSSSFQPKVRFFSTAPQDVGIKAIDVWFPKKAVSQTALEQFDGVGAGKYTAGLGQTSLAYVDDRQDINSMFLSAVKNFFDKYNVDPSTIGRLGVGTETLVDKSKAVKTYLMDLMGDNKNIEGVDSVNACYGGTSALLDAIHWVESKQWDGRNALVVMGDIAVYEPGPARPTAGCGAVVLLIGPDAPIVLDSGIKGNYSEHAYDFYKPLSQEWPVVDGKLSIECYIRALDSCYDSFKLRNKMLRGEDFDISKSDYFLFHSPFTALVQKSFGRLLYNDYKLNPSSLKDEELAKLLVKTREETWGDNKLISAFSKHSAPLYAQKVEPSLLLPKELGNSYTASIYTGIASLIHNEASNLPGKRATLFSYGSGLVAAMFSFTVKKSVEEMKAKMNLGERLAARTFVTPETFTSELKLREALPQPNFTPKGSLESVHPGDYYLDRIDDRYRRFYKQNC